MSLFDVYYVLYVIPDMIKNPITYIIVDAVIFVIWVILNRWKKHHDKKEWKKYCEEVRKRG